MIGPITTTGVHWEWLTSRDGMVQFLADIVNACLHLLIDASIYILLGLLAAGLIRVFLNPAVVASHLGAGRFGSVFKASLLGIPVPLRSRGALPAAVSLRKQGANKGAVTSFLISTSESGMDSIAITYALLDPVLTVMRPVAAFFTAAAAGIVENTSAKETTEQPIRPDLSCPVDGWRDRADRDSDTHRQRHGFPEKFVVGLRYAFTDFWSDQAGYFFIGLILAGLITVIAPDDFFTAYLGSGISAMLLMLAAGIPLSVRATASPPIAAALILKGVSPGAALVFLLVGPGANAATLTMLLGALGKRSTAIYLASIAVCAVMFGLAVDELYRLLEIPPRAEIGVAAETIPSWLAMAGAAMLLFISILPLWRQLKNRLRPSSPRPALQPVKIEEPEADEPTHGPGVKVCGPTWQCS